MEHDNIPMTSNLRAALLAWREERPCKQSPFVFCQEEPSRRDQKKGDPFTYRNSFLNRLCKRAGVPRFTWHAIRHLSASVLYRAGQSQSVIQAVLRHQSASTTARYLHSFGLEHTRGALEGVFASQGPCKVLPFVKKEEAPEVAASGARGSH